MLSGGSAKQPCVSKKSSRDGIREGLARSALQEIPEGIEWAREAEHGRDTDRSWASKEYHAREVMSLLLGLKKP